MRANSRLVVLAASALFVFAACLAFAQAPGITVQNTAQFVGDGRYNWKVFLAAPPSTLQSISYVEYTLYPTVTNPVQRRNNPADGFALQSNGRGEFNIAVKVVFKDGRKAPLQLTHYLSLQSGRAAAVKPDHSTAHGVLRTGNTSQPIGTGRWDFQIYIEGDERTLGDVKCVTYTLHPTFPDPIRMICAKGAVSGRGFQLSSNGWGTFTVGVDVQFKDGDVRRLTHDLVFAPAAQRKY